jgi:hypothetical protein
MLCVPPHAICSFGRSHVAPDWLKFKNPAALSAKRPKRKRYAAWRNGGSQFVRVEHVHVNEGSQGPGDAKAAWCPRRRTRSNNGFTGC